MSVISNTSSSKNTMNKSDILAILSTMETQMSALRTILAAIPDRKKAGRPSKKVPAAAPAPAPSPASDAASTVSSASKPKREINPQIVEYNKDRTRIFAELRSAWVAKNPALADLARAAWVDLPDTAEKAVKKAHNKAVKDFKEAVKTANAEAPPTYPDALKEHSRRLKEAKGTTAAVEPAPKPAEKPAKKSSKKATKSTDAPAPVADAASVATGTEPATKKRRGRPAMTADEKAAAKAARKAAKKAAKKAAELPPLPASPPESDSLDTDTESDGSDL